MLASGASVRPSLDLAMHARVLDVVRGLVADDVVVGVHDVADGGVALCVAEMAIASECGVEVRAASSDVDFFDETPSRIVVAVAEATSLPWSIGATLPTCPSSGSVPEAANGS